MTVIEFQHETVEMAMSTRIFVLAAMVALAACSSTARRSPFAETTAVCDSSGIESQYVTLRDKTSDWLGKLGDERNAKREIETVSRRLMAYSAEIDAQYRSVTSSCKAYSRCMEMNGYDEGDCWASRERWVSSERSFVNLARDLKEIEADVIIATSGHPRKKHRRVNKCEDGICY